MPHQMIQIAGRLESSPKPPVLSPTIDLSVSPTGPLMPPVTHGQSQVDALVYKLRRARGRHEVTSVQDVQAVMLDQSVTSVQAVMLETADAKIARLQVTFVASETKPLQCAIALRCV